MLIVNDAHLCLAGVASLEERCSYCFRPLAAYPLIMSDDTNQTVYHAACAIQLATDIMVDLYIFFSPPAPYPQLFVLTTPSAASATMPRGETVQKAGDSLSSRVATGTSRTRTHRSSRRRAVLYERIQAMPSTSNTYDEFASQYAQWMTAQEKVGVELDSNISQFLQVVGEVSGLTVLDAGCSEGYLSRILTHRGAQVIGIDISPRLVEMARAKDPTGEITYQVADLSQPLPTYQGHFDLIASFFVLNDVPDYRGFLTTLGSVLKPSGRLVLFMNNPYSLVLRGHITDYFAASGQAVPYRGLAEVGVQVHLYHRTLQDYLAASHSAGFQLQRLVDVPPPPGSFKRRNDMILPEGYHFPFFMILSFVKG